MIIVILLICLIGGVIVVGATDVDEFYFIPVAGFAVSFIALCILIVVNSAMLPLEDKIAMYEEENAKIEMQIADIVNEYQEFEKGIIGDVKTDSAITMIQLYPELTSNTLVQSQIEIYVDNNNQIKQLKCELLNRRVVRWWLYFGK